MAAVLALLPLAWEAPGGVEVIRCENAAQVLDALHTAGSPVILAAEGFTAAEEAAIAARIRERNCSVIEVRAERWDGVTHSPLSAACRGVVSGFGHAGVAAALALLERERRTAD